MNKTEAIEAVEIGNAEWIYKAERLCLAEFREMKRKRTLMYRSGFPLEFTTDTLWHVVRRAGMPREPRAMGALVRRLQRDGWIQATAEFKESRRKSCHSRPVRVWQVM